MRMDTSRFVRAQSGSCTMPYQQYIKTISYPLSLLSTPVWLFDVGNLRVLWANQAGLDLWNAPDLAELQGRDMSDGMTRTVCERLGQYCEDLSGTSNSVAEHWTFYPMGRSCSYECSISAIEAPDDARWLLINAIRQDKLSDSDTLYRSVALLHTSVCVSVFDRQGRLMYSNPAARRMLGADVLTLSERFLDEKDWQLAHDTLTHGAGASIEAQMKTAKGPVWHSLTLELCPDPVSGKKSILMSEIDISNQHNAQQLVNRLAYTDTLTGLPNRTSWLSTLNDRLDSARQERRELAILFVDLDRFKLINDTLGHSLGDKLLVAVSDRLKGCLDASDYLARLGGDEFTLLIDEQGAAGRSERMARDLVEALAKPMRVDGHAMTMTPSIGICLFPQHAEDSTLLMQQADMAMYAAKEAGGGYRTFKPDMTTQIRRRLRIETDLREAIDSGSLQVYFQPKLAAADGRMAGMEALVRWEHPLLGWVPPEDFIAVAEETGMIGDITRQVLHHSMLQQTLWSAQGHDIPVAINVSPMEFRRGDFDSVVRDALQLTNCRPQSIELEITESMLMADSESVQQILAGLTSLGVRLSIDDFGSGYSNLGYLQKFPLDSIKIDRSFLDDGGISPVVELIIDVARTLSLTVVAEGVETTEQRNFLIAHGCDQLQGFLFSKPMDKHRATDFLLEHDNGIAHWSSHAVSAEWAVQRRREELAENP